MKITNRDHVKRAILCQPLMRRRPEMLELSLYHQCRQNDQPQQSFNAGIVTATPAAGVGRRQ
jgi:hypothetical protein